MVRKSFPGLVVDAGATANQSPGSQSSGSQSQGGPWLTGQALVAMPGLAGSVFARSVIYLCAHTPDGAMGIVLNQPLASPSFEDLLKTLGVAPLPPARSIRLYSGGPVENGRGFVLHTTDWTGEGSLRVDDTLALTASLDILKAIAEGGGPEQGMLALGYAGWAPGQLDREMQENSWLSVPLGADDLGLVFDSDYESKWQRALARLGVNPVLLSGTAGHA
jgi:putative transcriptional regulator